MTWPLLETQCALLSKKNFWRESTILLTGQDVYKLALYTNSASFTAATTAYTTSNEVSASGSYSAGGGALTNVTPTTSGTTAFTDFADKTYTSATITARGALIYNTQTGGGSGTTNTVVVLDFGSDKSSTSGDFQIVFQRLTQQTRLSV